MKREGRQHGMVRSYMILPPPWNSRPKTKVVNQFSSPPTAGLYTKVPSKPTNHSKFTGKCGKARCVGCHLHPACKSEEKRKGARKLRSLDVSMNHRLVAWRVVDNGAGFSCSGGISATGMLDYLSGEYLETLDCEVEDDHLEGDVEDSAAFEDGPQAGSSGVVEDGKKMAPVFEIGIEEDGDFGFYDVGFGWDFDLDNFEDWCIVEGVDETLDCEVEDDHLEGDVEDSAAFEDGPQAGSSGAVEDGKKIAPVFEIGIEEDGDFGFYDIGFGWDFDLDNCEDWCIVEGA